MSPEIIGLHQWFDSPPGRYLLEWEQACLDEAVADIFGYHALQLGMPLLDGLRSNRMPHRWMAWGGSDQAWTASASILSPAHLQAESVALPFPEASLDLLILPHTLELSCDPHAALREVERVLVPEGRVILCGLNPLSLWALRQHRARLYRRMGVGTLYLPELGEFIGYHRLRDWLRLLSFEVVSARFGCYRPAVRSEQWLQRWAWMDRLGPRWWPVVGAAYFVVAVKRVHGMRLIGPAWSKAPLPRAGSVAVSRHSATRQPVKRVSIP